MAKKKPSKSVNIQPEIKENNSLGLPQKYQHIVALLFLFIVLSIVFFKIGYQGYEPKTHDSMQWAASAKVLQDYNAEHKDQALWAPNIFAGMPSYLVSLPNKYPFIKETLALSKKIVNWRLTYLFLGAAGMYLIGVYFGFGALIAVIMGLAFALTGHVVGLLDIGHNTKFRAIMFIPWIFWSLFYLRDKRNLLGLGLFSAFLIAQFRANHLQITYYTLLFVGVYWIYELILALKSKDMKDFGLFTALGIVAAIIVTMAVMNPFLSTYEYSKYTIRGGDTGLDKDYAQGWSLHPAELWSFIVPDLFGGISIPVKGELNRYGLPGYWGWMTFTQVYHYVGLVILLLAILALVLNRRKEVVFLWISLAIFTLMSFGKYSPGLSDFLLKFLPGFNKFRVPVTILVVCQGAVVVLAGFGLKAVLSSQNKKSQKQLKITFFSFVGLAVLGLVLGRSIMAGSDLMTAKEAQYPANILQQLKDVRLNMAYNGIIRAVLFGVLTLGLSWMYSLKKLKQLPYLLLIMAAVFIDLKIVDNNYMNDMKKARKKELKADSIARYIQKQDGHYRLHYPEKSMDNTYSAFVPTTSGYHGAKLTRYQKYWENPEYFNSMNFINMMNGKYILSTKDLGRALVTKGELKLFQNPMALPKAWFVDNVRVAELSKIPAQVSSNLFNPANTALVEKEVLEVNTPTNTDVKVAEYGLHRLAFNATTDKQALMVVSEVYYPAGWNAYIDGKATEIYPVNGILRGIVVPEGNHEIVMEFKPKSYYTGLRLSLIGLILSILATAVGSYQLIRRKQWN